jgi:hypothetical protein
MPPKQVTPARIYPICQGNLDVPEGSKVDTKPKIQNTRIAKRINAVIIRT